MITNGDIKRNIAGQVTVSGTTEVTISVPALEANSVVLLSLNTASGTVANAYLSSKDLATKTIGVKSSGTNASVYDVVVFA